MLPKRRKYQIELSAEVELTDKAHVAGLLFPSDAVHSLHVIRPLCEHLKKKK
jgi:hypothetical protein